MTLRALEQRLGLRRAAAGQVHGPDGAQRRFIGLAPPTLVGARRPDLVLVLVARCAGVGYERRLGQRARDAVVPLVSHEAVEQARHVTGDAAGAALARVVVRVCAPTLVLVAAAAERIGMPGTPEPGPVRLVAAGAGQLALPVARAPNETRVLVDLPGRGAVGEQSVPIFQDGDEVGRVGGPPIAGGGRAAVAARADGGRRTRAQHSELGQRLARIELRPGVAVRLSRTVASLAVDGGIPPGRLHVGRSRVQAQARPAGVAARALDLERAVAHGRERGRGGRPRRSANLVQDIGDGTPRLPAQIKALFKDPVVARRIAAQVGLHPVRADGKVETRIGLGLRQCVPGMRRLFPLLGLATMARPAGCDAGGGGPGVGTKPEKEQEHDGPRVRQGSGGAGADPAQKKSSRRRPASRMWRHSVVRWMPIRRAARVTHPAVRRSASWMRSSRRAGRP